MQKFRQVSGGNCQLVLFQEIKPGVPDPADSGVVLAIYSESMSMDSKKQGSAVITNARGQGKPVPGTPNYSGGLDVPPYAPQMGHILRALCGAPATSAEPAVNLAQEFFTGAAGGAGNFLIIPGFFQSLKNTDIIVLGKLIQGINGFFANTARRSIDNTQ